MRITASQVNTASRMESTGEPMRIHMTEPSALALLATGKWACEKRSDEVAIKGKGTMSTLFSVQSPLLASPRCSINDPSLLGH